ncbi:MAG TPA: NADH-quinone oxidoreductase subunit M [Roseiflexaceae bacterium]|nr:NADH-quinone oxidoreductase subunit M [Roseiflexaceae bacterium]
MNQLGFPLLSIVLWLPTIGALLLLLVPRDNLGAQRMLALLVALATFAASLPFYFAFDFTNAGFQFADLLPWVPSWGINYSVSLDGVSLWLVLLTTFLTPITLISTWDSVHKDFRSFQALMLLLETGMLGVFVAQDMFLFYIFWEFTLIPMALLIGMWGSANRVRAAVKFFLYTFAGSVFMLLGIIALYLFNSDATQVPTFDFPTIQQSITSGQLAIDQTWARTLFFAFFIAFAIKVPIWPFHTWLPLAHTEAPTAGSVILAGVLLKLGGYGMIRFCLQLFPEAANWAAPAIGVLAVIGILYGALVSFAQTDAKKLVAYSSVSHLGFVVLGIFALNDLGISGAILQMVNHGLSTGALFLVVGMIYERRHTREMAAFGGLWKVMPIYGGLALAMVLSSVGLPGLNGFIGEFTIMQGAWVSAALGWYFVLPAVIGVIFAATYLLRMFRLTFMGDVTNPENAALQDITPREIGMLVALLVPIVVIGFYPNLLFEPMQPAVQAIAQQLNGALAGVR